MTSAVRSPLVRRSALACAALAAIAAYALAAGAPAPAAVAANPDSLAARAVFEANLDAIRHRDRDAYLACYLDSPRLARTGPGGPSLGFDSLRATAGQGWPDHFEGTDLRLVPLRPGLVYGTYRYRVRYGTEEQAGLSERLFVETPAGWKIAMTSAFQAPPGTPPPPRALVGATLVDGTGRPPVRDAVVVLRAGKIECAGPRARCPVPAGVDTLDVRGCWIVPGLVDAHVHYSQTGWADGRPDAMDVRNARPYAETIAGLRAHPERFHRSWLACGVTAVFDVGGYPWTIEMARAAEASREAPHVAAAGPLLSTLDHWLNLPAERQFLYLADDSTTRADVRYLKAIGAAAVKVWFIENRARSMEEMERVVRVAADEAAQVRLPMIVHATTLATAKAALRAGARLLVHSVEDRPVDAEFLTLAKKSGAIYCPTLAVREGYWRMWATAQQGRAPVVDDPNHVVDPGTIERLKENAYYAEAARSRTLPDAKARDERWRILAGNLLAVRRAGIPIATGTDAGNPLTLHGPSIYVEMEAMQRAGIPAPEVIVCSTRNGARAMGRDDFGTVEPGKDADLLIVGADPTADVRNLRRGRWVVRGGVVRTLDELVRAIRSSTPR